MSNTKKAFINKSLCVACGCCEKVCPRKAISIPYGVFAQIDTTQCVGCALCQKACPASIITINSSEDS